MMKQKTRKQLLIEKFVKIPEGNRRFWPREMKLLGQLEKEYSLDLLEFVVLGYLVNSLAFFKTDKGKSSLRMMLKDYFSDL